MDEIYEEIIRLKRSGREGVLVTVTDREGHTPADIGAKMLVIPKCSEYKEFDTIGTVGGGTLEHLAVNYARKVLKFRTSGVNKYVLSRDNEVLTENESLEAQKTGMLCGGTASLFFEYIGVREVAVIFGGGHIGSALVGFLKPLNFAITVVDDREEVVSQIDGVDKAVCGKYEEVFGGEGFPDEAFAVICGYSHEKDYVIFRRFFTEGWKPRYIGLLASKPKRDSMFERIRQELGKTPDLSRVYSPVGLNIGGKTPAEIALSVACEIQAIRYGKNDNRFMRDL
jgi:xanthine dehydrogenase accessory factor